MRLLPKVNHEFLKFHVHSKFQLKLTGVNFTGAIVLARYGRNFRGLKVYIPLRGVYNTSESIFFCSRLKLQRSSVPLVFSSTLIHGTMALSLRRMAMHRVYLLIYYDHVT